MSQVRLRRLKADYERLCTLFTGKTCVRIRKTMGDPPERYLLEYLVKGLEKRLSDGKIVMRNSFLVEITLTGAYPRMAPQCRMLTPVFHPNIAPHAICIGDHWAAGESLAQLVVRIAEMISYQAFNVKSPLNGEAAKWVEQNQDRIPLDSFDFSSLLFVGEAAGRSADGRLVAGDVCANCGKKGDPASMQVCADGHTACSECALSCPLCKKTVCLKCPLLTCSVCNTTVCGACGYKCSSCGRVVCLQHRGTCHVCKTSHCEDCLVACARCGQPACMDHIRKALRPDGSPAYVCSACATTLSAHTAGARARR
jgi:ubiquitin-protein ligase